MDDDCDHTITRHLCICGNLNATDNIIRIKGFELVKSRNVENTSSSAARNDAPADRRAVLGGGVRMGLGVGLGT